MAALAASDVTYTQGVQKSTGSRIMRTITIAFCDGALTYPSGGVPLTKAKMGCPNVVEVLVLRDAANDNGYLYKWDKANNKLRIYQGDNDNVADAANIELLTSIAPAAASLVCEVIGW